VKDDKAQPEADKFQVNVAQPEAQQTAPATSEQQDSSSESVSQGVSAPWTENEEEMC